MGQGNIITKLKFLGEAVKYRTDSVKNERSDMEEKLGKRYRRDHQRRI